MQNERPPPNGEVKARVHLASRTSPTGSRLADISEQVLEQVLHRLRIASILADRDLVHRYAERLYVTEQSLRDLLSDAEEITKIEMRRRLPGDLLFLLSHLLTKEIDK